MIGTKTALTDNASLTTREIVGRNPVRILIDFDLKVPHDFKIFSNEAPTLVFNSLKKSEEGHVKFIKIEKENFLDQFMQKLFEEQIQSVIIEGGSFTLTEFIKAGIWDEAVIIKNENLNLIHGTKAPEFEFELEKEMQLRDNLLYFYRNNQK